MLTNSRIRSVIQKIIDFHGRCEQIQLFDKCPPPPSEESKDQKSKAKKGAKKQLTGDDGAVEDEEETKTLAKEEVQEPPKYKTYDNPSMILFEIFETYGVELKSELDDEECAKEFSRELWYDFKPYNSKDPVLLALMHKDYATGRTI